MPGQGEPTDPVRKAAAAMDAAEGAAVESKPIRFEIAPGVWETAKNAQEVAEMRAAYRTGN